MLHFCKLIHHTYIITNITFAYSYIKFIDLDYSED